MDENAENEVFDVDALFELPTEDITDDQRRALVEHYRGLRVKFAKLDEKGKARDMAKKAATTELTDDELLNAKVLG